jgi:hypothetical protein
MKLNLMQVVVDYLKARPDEKFTARQIAEWIVATYPQECQAKKARSKSLQTDADLLRQIVAEIGAHHRDLLRKHPELKTTEGRPRRYYYSQLSDSDEVAVAEREEMTPEARRARPVPAAVAVSVGRVRRVLQAHRRKALVEQTRAERQPLAVPGCGRHGGFEQGMAPRSARLRHAVFR